MDGRQKRTTPDEAAQYIRFALSELGERNAHHEFEHLCRNLTRKRICPNIIPSTGPVSAGGDKGIDFESYPVIGTENERDSPSFFGWAAEDPTIFACSLRKDFETKISQDVRKVSGQGDKPNVVYFSNQPIQKSKQAELISRVWTDFAVRLRIFDCHAISELLADPEVFWIAQQYLSIPSDFLLRQTDGSPEWYQAAYATEIDQADLTAAAFFETKDALRYAANNPAHNSDIPVLIAKLRMFRGHPFSVIRRKAIYEEFVASLRGLGVVEGTGPDLQEYFREIKTLTGLRPSPTSM